MRFIRRPRIRKELQLRISVPWKCIAGATAEGFASRGFGTRALFQGETGNFRHSTVDWREAILGSSHSWTGMVYNSFKRHRDSQILDSFDCTKPARASESLRSLHFDASERFAP